jgi:hypothetical protein
MIAKEGIQAKFEKIGAVVVFEDAAARGRRLWQIENEHRAVRVADDSEVNASRLTHVVDMKVIDRCETFIVDTFDDPKARVEVLDIRPRDRHLLLMVADGKEKAKYLMGHDERHWFAAAIPESAHAKNVADAMDALKPTRVLTKQTKAGVKAKNRNRRKNDAYIRQGEWFFIPARQFEQSDCVIHKSEPIQRGLHSKPHICEELIRKGGSIVWVHPKLAPNGVTEIRANTIRMRNVARIANDHLEWTQRVAEASVYVRGYVKHSDHKTIHLKGWHKVLPNTESKAKAGRFLRFLD